LGRWLKNGLVKGGRGLDRFFVVGVLECFAEFAHAGGYLLSKSEDKRRPPGLSYLFGRELCPTSTFIPTEDTLHLATF